MPTTVTLIICSFSLTMTCIIYNKNRQPVMNEGFLQGDQGKRDRFREGTSQWDSPLWVGCTPKWSYDNTRDAKNQETTKGLVIEGSRSY